MVFDMQFWQVALLMSAATLMLTEKLKDLFKASGAIVKYVLSFISCALVTLATKYLGVAVAWGLLGMIGTAPDKPVIPSEPLGWGYWLFMFVLSWLLASGLYDYLKPLFNKRD